MFLGNIVTSSHVFLLSAATKQFEPKQTVEHIRDVIVTSASTVELIGPCHLFFLSFFLKKVFLNHCHATWPWAGWDEDGVSAQLL